jgi:glutamate dehydrogenase (NAD(P)+)
MLIAREAMKKLGLKPQDARVVVQGAGNVGGIGAMLMHREGYKIISISDMYGAILNDKGLDMPAVLAHIKKTGRLDGFAEAEPVDSLEAIEMPCEVLVPAATENQITTQNVDRIKTRLIVEGANGPCTAKASRILDERGVMVVPDILANAGGVTVSYFEWVQDRMGYFWTEERVNNSLEQVMVKSFDDVWNVSLKYQVSMRIAAYILAIDRVAAVYRLRGVFA